MLKYVNNINKNLKKLKEEMEKKNKSINFFNLVLIRDEETETISLNVESSAILDKEITLEEFTNLTFYELFKSKISFDKLSNSLQVGEETREEYLEIIEKEFNKLNKRLGEDI